MDVLIITLIGIAMFAKVSSAYFCGFDDFNETHRALFEDSQNRTLIFTTTHFGSTKYRPLNRLTTYLCWMIGRGSALPFRIRNLLFHLVCVLGVYGLALLWTRERSIALVAGLFFCVEPSANQTVVAAIFTNTMAYAFLLVSLLLFMLWLQTRRSGWLALSFFSVLLGTFCYEPVIVVIPMMAGYLALEAYRGRSTPHKQLAIYVGGSAGVILAFAFIRHLVVRGVNPQVSLRAMVNNAILYAGALISPVDVVTANQLFGSPLPPQLHVGTRVLVLLLAVLVALVLALVAYLNTTSVRAGIRRLDKALVIYLLLSIPLALSTFLLFTPHASETYLYLPAAFYAILLGLLLRALLPSKPLFRSTVVLILLCFGIGSWIRNRRVAECGQIAHTILTALPVSQWQSGNWNIMLSNVSAPPPRYGIYNYEGLSTIDPADPETGNGAQSALQIVTGNPQLKADVVDPLKMSSSCLKPYRCFEVSLNGSVEEVTSRLAEK